ncbi:MAG TPA: hypothetical protein PK228_06950 [Saprospiraceae bacterium]|nr:hypothetical protein [Saprospiraceae bacterium]
MKRLLLPLQFVYTVISFVQAQDNHYESDQLGSQNAILCGASISRWVDQTAVINNAATMIFAKEAGITLNTATARIDNILFLNGLGDHFDLRSNSTLVFPGLIAWEIPSLKRVDQRTVGFSIYGRMHDRLRFTNRAVFDANVIDDAESPGEEVYTGLYALDSDVDEAVGTLGWGERLSDEWAIGFTTQVIFRNHKYSESFSATVVPNPDSAMDMDAVRGETNTSLLYNATLLQFKASVAWQKDDWSAGLIVTAPTIRIWSAGDMLAEINLINMRVHPDKPRNSYFANTYLSKSKPRYKYPFSIDGGVSRNLNKVQFSVAASLYASLARYTIFDPDEETYLQPPGGDNVIYSPRLFEVWGINRSIVNFSTSATWTLSDMASLLFGFRTDQHFSEIPPAEENVPGFQLSKKIWNRYHFNGGAEIRWRRSFWILGVQYSRGRADNYPTPFSYSGATEGNFLQGEPGYGTISQNGVSFLLSFFIQFQRKEDRKKED